MSISISDKEQIYLNSLLTQYETKRAALLPVLHFLQNKIGWLTPESEEFAATFLELPLIKVREVISFYSLFYNKPKGKHHIQVCQSIGCHLNGCNNILKHIEKETGIIHGEVSKDGLFSLAHVECLAACDQGPVIRVNDEYVPHITEEKFSQMIQNWKKSS